MKKYTHKCIECDYKVNYGWVLIGCSMICPECGNKLVGIRLDEELVLKTSKAG